MPAIETQLLIQVSPLHSHFDSIQRPRFETPNKRKKGATQIVGVPYFADFCGQREGLFHALFVHKIRRRFGGSCFPSLLHLPWAVVSCFYRNSKLPFHYYWKVAHKQRILYALLNLFADLIKKRLIKWRKGQIANLDLPISPIFVDRGKYFSMHNSYIKLEDDLEVDVFQAFSICLGPLSVASIEIPNCHSIIIGKLYTNSAFSKLSLICSPT